MEAEREQRAVQSVEVGGRLLLALAEMPGPQSLKDLAAKAGLPPSRAHPYLVSYGRLRLVEQDPASGRYRLGPGALKLGLACLAQMEPVTAALPVAQALADETGQAVALAVWGNLGPTVVRMFEAREPLHVAMRAGTVMSVLGTATGRAFAAVLPEERLRAVFASMPGGGLGELADAPTPASVDAAARQAPRRAARGAPSWPTPEQAQALRQAREDWARHRLVRAQGRPIPGVNAFSSPVFDHEGQAVLAVTALGHQDRFVAAWNAPMAERVRRAAAEISDRLGGSMPGSASG